ncbi:MAG: hypothetical protein HC902_09335 [Calothrix sp. SM1_5_4]|nr:hypothetical protein [Calothrix sp. SM1_5_4]
MPTLLYVDVDNAAGCNASNQPIANLPQREVSRQLLQQPFPQGLGASDLFTWRQDSFLADSDYQFSIGVEKNPWYMPYMGVKAQVAPRQIFFPFGDSVELVARAFAKPFGGRIGPWYQSKWDRGAQSSTGGIDGFTDGSEGRRRGADEQSERSEEVAQLFAFSGRYARVEIQARAERHRGARAPRNQL